MCLEKHSIEKTKIVIKFKTNDEEKFKNLIEVYFDNNVETTINIGSDSPECFEKINSIILNEIIDKDIIFEKDIPKKIEDFKEKPIKYLVLDKILESYEDEVSKIKDILKK